MPEIEEECIFNTRADQVQLLTRTNGDEIVIRGLNLNQAQASSLAWLINTDTVAELEFQIKVKGT